MISKLIFVSASLCVVSASVITINVFDDDPDTKVVHKLKDCNVQACDQLCRKLGFPGGACVKGRCDCDNFRHSEAETSIAAESLSNPEQSVSVRDCNLRACEQLCRRLGYPGGACVNGRCDCDHFFNTEDAVSETAESPAERSCNYQECDQRCRRLGFPGGACVNGLCKCDKFRNAEDAVSETAEYLAERSCNYKECDQRCRRLGFPGGACVNGLCKCDNFRNAEVTDGEAENAKVVSKRKCSSDLQCDVPCRKLGYRQGFCVRGKCECSLLPYEEDGVSERAQTTSDLAESISPRKCSSDRECEEGCHKLGLRKGYCVYGKCHCSFISYEGEVTDGVTTRAETISDLAESISPRKCSSDRECEEGCHKLGFRKGYCVYGKCHCSILSYAGEDLLPINDVTSNEVDEESEVVNEGELTDPLVRACNTANCNEMCHRLNFAGGICRGGSCECY